MNYRTYGKLGYEVSTLGLGCMRLPRTYDGSNKAEVDREKAYEIIRYAAAHGINYFDTALTYHNGDSENVLGEALEGGLREKVKIATKQPFANMKPNGGPRKNLEETLKKLRTDHIDIYLIHNIQAKDWEDIKRAKVYDEYLKFREEGLIKAIGCSIHGDFPHFKNVIGEYPWDMVQIQQNIIDSDKEVTEEAIKLAGKIGCALVIMEPLRGGGLANAPRKVREIYDSYPVKRPAYEWAFRHVANYPQVSCILSGMTTLDQLKQNIEIFSMPDMVPRCLTETEKTIIEEAKSAYKSLAAIPCTGCEYCMPCPKGVNIPRTFATYNAGIMFEDFDQPKRSYMYQSKYSEGADNCVACHACEKKCPQNLDIVNNLKTAHNALRGWIE
ncbi:MAG: aldo/keto reductase [Oscillospiraceae bacterium]